MYLSQVINIFHNQCFVTYVYFIKKECFTIMKPNNNINLSLFALTSKLIEICFGRKVIIFYTHHKHQTEYLVIRNGQYNNTTTVGFITNPFGYCKVDISPLTLQEIYYLSTSLCLLYLRHFLVIVHRLSSNNLTFNVWRIRRKFTRLYNNWGLQSPPLFY